MIRLLLSINFIFFILQLTAADIKGKVTDAEGQPIVDAYVLSTNGTLYASSNELGIFIYKNAQIGDTLVVSYLGFEPQEVILAAPDFDQLMTIVLEDHYFNLEQVHVSNSIKTTNQLASINLLTNPVKTSQEILRKVPGLFIGQHAGGGKAEQLFLRGFDIDHGTDIALSVDGLPVNMVSHAHGQGYADLHFLIPETVERIDFGKGPYYANRGNFNTAGYVNFQTKDKLEASSISLELGQFNTQRGTVLLNLLDNTASQSAYIAGEYQTSDGPFESPQGFHRLNLMAKYVLSLPNNDKLSILASHFDSQWDASGQIPQRAVDSGLITRFGAIDDTEGGFTSRTNFALNYTKNISDQSFIKNNIYFSHYDFELFSNFTFFANDPVNGDQIRQQENRNIFGWESNWHKTTALENGGEVQYQVGGGLRYDHVTEVGLWRTLNRTTTLSALSQGEVMETNLFAFAQAEYTFGKWLFNPVLRVDFFNYHFLDELSTEFPDLTQQQTQLSPKFNILYTPKQDLQFFLKSGIGFHSNDSRVVVTQQEKQTLPAAYGLDIGTNFKPTDRMWVNTALWYLFLEQEFVYVGDEAIVEPSGKTQRLGIDVSVRWQLLKHLFYNTDVNYTFARSIEEEKGENFIPLAPDLTMTGGLSLQLDNGLSGGISYRYIKDRPATEDNRIVAEGYFMTDVNMTYQFKNISIGWTIENLFNQEWNEAQFATESRLLNEPNAIEELHFTPGSPFFFKGKVSYSF